MIPIACSMEIPKDLKILVDAQIPSEDQKSNPEALNSAVQFYLYQQMTEGVGVATLASGVVDDCAAGAIAENEKEKPVLRPTDGVAKQRVDLK
jgi:hypothetical protein